MRNPPEGLVRVKMLVQPVWVEDLQVSKLPGPAAAAAREPHPKQPACTHLPVQLPGNSSGGSLQPLARPGLFTGQISLDA